MRPTRLSILGVGLLGGSIGLAWRASASACRIAGYGHRRPSLDKALEFGAIDEAYDDPAAAVRESDLVILCTPVGQFERMLKTISPVLKPGAIVTDVGSTKRSIVRAAEQWLPAAVHFVGSHPMAGSEKRGVEFARADLFDKALCLTTPTPRTDPIAIERVESFWKSLGMRIIRLSPEDHDRDLADVSHLPHAVAAALVAMQRSDALPLAGKGFLDATRIAGGDGALWRDIFHDNRDNVRSSLQRLRDQLDYLQRLLEPEQADALAAWLDTAAARREALLREKLSEVTPD